MSELTIKDKWKHFAFWHFVYEFGGELEAHEVFDQLVNASPSDRGKLVESLEIEFYTPWCSVGTDTNELVSMMLELATEAQRVEGY
jgi:hypothetical protein